jgi:hypothetical protein
MATPPKRSRTTLWIIIAVVVVIVVVIIAALAYVASTSVVVIAIDFTSTDNACGTAGNSVPGFTTSTGGTAQYTLTILDPYSSTSCTVSSVSAVTSGFSVSGANTPLTVPVGGSESLSFTVTAPSSSFTGVLTIDLE